MGLLSPLRRWDTAAPRLKELLPDHIGGGAGASAPVSDFLSCLTRGRRGQGTYPGTHSEDQHADRGVDSKVESLRPVWLFATSWTVAYQAPPFMRFSRQEYWSGLPFPSLGDLPPRDRTRASRIAGRHFTIWASKGEEKQRPRGDSRVWEEGACIGCH